MRRAPLCGVLCLSVLLSFKAYLSLLPAHGPEAIGRPPGPSSLAPETDRPEAAPAHPARAETEATVESQLRQVDVGPILAANSSKVRRCDRPTVSSATLRVRWRQPREAATIYYDRLRAAGVTLHTAGIPVPPARRRPYVTYSSAPITVARPVWRARWDPGGTVAPEPPLFVAVFRDVWVTGGWVLECRRAFTAGGCYQADADLHPVQTPRHFPKGFVLGDPWSHGYFHWTQEHLPRLAVMYDALRRDPDIRIMAPTTKFAVSFLRDVLGLGPDRLLPHTGEYRFGLAYYATPMLCGHALLQAQLLLRSLVLHRLNLTGAAAISVPIPTVLFALRRDARRPRNHGALVAACRTAFPTVRVREADFSGVPVAQQIAAFNGADVVVGPHGANLANLVYMRRHAAVVEFVPGRTGNPCYYGMASRLGLEYRVVVLPNIPQGHAHEVNVTEVLRHIADVVARLRPPTAPTQRVPL